MTVPDTKATSELMTTYLEALAQGSASMFVGAGLSADAGYPKWKELLKSLGQSLKIDLDTETDLVSVAQFYVNSEESARGKLETLVRVTFTAEPDHIPETFRSIASLPLHSIWTTNYDDLIERAFAGKPLVVRRRQHELRERKRAGETVLYKMHGCAQEPQSIVITRDDYESYERTHNGFMQVLASDYLERTILFVGLSFTDPNLYHLLRLIRSIFPASAPTHYALMRRPHPSDSSPTDHARTARRFELWASDMARYGVNVVPVDEYGEVAEILSEIEARHLRQTVFVSGSRRLAREDTPEEKRLARLCHEIGRLLARTGKRIVSKYRTTIGSALVGGFVEGLYEGRADGIKGLDDIDRRMLIRPTKRPSHVDWSAFHDEISQSLISQAGICFVIRGGPATAVDVKEAMKLGRSVIAIPGTGGTADSMLSAIRENADQSGTNQGKRDADCMKRLRKIEFSLTDTDCDAKIAEVVTELKEYLVNGA